MKIFIGVIIGIFLCVSSFEFIHNTVEVDGFPMCGMIYDKLTDKWHSDFTYQLRVIYKIFAYPAKTTWIAISKKEIATAGGLGKNICSGNWQFKKTGGWE